MRNLELVLMGPSGAGKSTIMRGLAARNSGDWRYRVAPPVTNRPRRPGEGDEEMRFVDPETFEWLRPGFLFTMRSYGQYEYGLERPKPRALGEIGVRALLPEHALRFSRYMQREAGGAVLLCAIVPHAGPEELERRMWARDPGADPADIAVRVGRIDQDTRAAVEAANLVFYDEGCGPSVEVCGMNEAASLFFNFSHAA